MSRPTNTSSSPEFDLSYGDHVCLAASSDDALRSLKSIIETAHRRRDTIIGISCTHLLQRVWEHFDNGEKPNPKEIQLASRSDLTDSDRPFDPKTAASRLVGWVEDAIVSTDRGVLVLFCFSSWHTEIGREDVSLFQAHLSASLEGLRAVLAGCVCDDAPPLFQATIFSSFPHIIEKDALLSNPSHIDPGLILEKGIDAAMRDGLLNRARASLRGSPRRLYTSLLDDANFGFSVYSCEVGGRPGRKVFRLIEANPAFESMAKTSRSDLVGKRLEELVPGITASHLSQLETVISRHITRRFELTGSDDAVGFDVTAFEITTDRLGLVLIETGRVLSTKNHLSAGRFQIRQSQKMEAIGRLAGGVAHDFNNILTAISGLSDVLLDEFPAEAPYRADVAEIKKAANRAAVLTRQLLAFSRKQVVAPRNVDLFEITQSLHKMLDRIIGEDIELSAVSDSPLGKVRVDPGQIEQILANLAANARDAMPRGGKLIIETRNVKLDEEFCLDHEEISPGDYVLLSVRDTGHGMEPHVLERIFEPFFTTKIQGRGTGLGLATVYGIVKQNRGSIGVYSRLGQGTTFDIFLPRVEAPADAIVDKNEMASPCGGDEVVLLVEDEDMVRSLAKRILERYGYTVFSAPSGVEALRAHRDRIQEVDLLVTDVVMPHMNGRELYDKLKALRPKLRALFMSGYPAEVIERQGAQSGALPFIEKPFHAEDLMRKVREVLDS